MKTLKAVYVALFQVFFDVLYTLSLTGHDETLVAQRAVFGFTAFQLMLIGSTEQWWIMLRGTALIAQSVGLLVLLGLGGFNYVVLLRKGWWLDHSRAMRQLPARKQAAIRWGARTAVGLVVLGGAYTFHRFWFWGVPGQGGR